MSINGFESTGEGHTQDTMLTYHLRPEPEAPSDDVLSDLDFVKFSKLKNEYHRSGETLVDSFSKPHAAHHPYVDGEGLYFIDEPRNPVPALVSRNTSSGVEIPKKSLTAYPGSVFDVIVEPAVDTNLGLGNLNNIVDVDGGKGIRAVEDTVWEKGGVHEVVTPEYVHEGANGEDVLRRVIAREIDLFIARVPRDERGAKRSAFTSLISERERILSDISTGLWNQERALSTEDERLKIVIGSALRIFPHRALSLFDELVEVKQKELKKHLNRNFKTAFEAETEVARDRAILRASEHLGRKVPKDVSKRIRMERTDPAALPRMLAMNGVLGGLLALAAFGYFQSTEMSVSAPRAAYDTTLNGGAVRAHPLPENVTPVGAHIEDEAGLNNPLMQDSDGFEDVESKIQWSRVDSGHLVPSVDVFGDSVMVNTETGMMYLDTDSRRN